MRVSALKNQEEILKGNLWKAILSLAVPVFINSFIQTMYNLTDTYWLGKLGTEQLAAINLVTPVQNIIINFGSGITVAGSVLIAQYVGAGEKRAARGIANQIFVCAMGFALVCAAVCFLFTPAIVQWLGADGETCRHAVVYLRVVLWDMPFLFMVNIFSAVHQSQGDAVSPMFLNLLGIVLNMILDPALIVLFGMGVAGAALATVFAKLVPAAVAFYLLAKSGDDVALDRKCMHLEREGVGLILRIGLPTAIGGGILSVPSVSTAVVGIFSEDPGVIAMAADFLSIMAFWCFANGVYNSTTGLFNGTGHTEVTMAISATRLWVFRFVTLWFCESVLKLGVRSVWYSVVVSNGISAVILYILYLTGIWKKSKIRTHKEYDKEKKSSAA